MAGGYLTSVAAVWKPLGAARAEEPVDGSSSPSDDDDAAARSFCSSLSARVGELGRSLGEGPVSLRWSAEAMRVLRWTQAELLHLSRRSNLSDDSVDEEGWLNLYMEDAAALLDLCNHLRSVATAIATYRMTVDLAIRRMENGSTLGLESLEVEHRKVLEATRRSIASALKEAAAPSPLKIQSPVSIAALAARCANVAISTALLSAFVSPVSIDVCEEFVDRKISEMLPLEESAVADLVGRIRERFVAGSALAEEELVRVCVLELIRQLDGGNPEEERRVSCLDVLRRRSAALKEAIEAFCEAAGQVFDAVCRCRNELLGTLRDRRLQSGS